MPPFKSLGASVPGSSAPTGGHHGRGLRLPKWVCHWWLVAGGADIPAAVRDATGGRGADVVLDCVGDVMFRHALDCLALRGRLVEMSVNGAREVTFNLADFYHNENHLIGIDTLKLDLTASAGI